MISGYKGMLLAYLGIFMVFLLIFCFHSYVPVGYYQQAVGDSVCFVVDAGHGGEDGGAVSCTGIYESHMNLEIALRLDDLLHLMGYKTVMIRESDISIYTTGQSLGAKKASDLKQRVKIVNETPGAILLSIHQNHYHDSQYYGAQMFYAATDESDTLAMCLQNSFVNSLNIGSNRKCKKAEGIYLMRNIQKPGVLIECGFLSNPQEEALLRSDAYQKKICCVIAAACSQFVSNRSVT